MMPLQHTHQLTKHQITLCLSHCYLTYCCSTPSARKAAIEKFPFGVQATLKMAALIEVFFFLLTIIISWLLRTTHCLNSSCSMMALNALAAIVVAELACVGIFIYTYELAHRHKHIWRIFAAHTHTRSQIALSYTKH